MKGSKRRVVRRAWLVRAAIMGAAVAFSAGAPAAKVPAVAASVQAAGEESREQVRRFGRFRICWGTCWYGWCCYFRPHF